MTAKRPPTREQLLDVMRQQEAVKYGKNLLEKKKDVLLRKLEDDRARFRELEEEFTRMTDALGFYYALARMYEGQGIIEMLKPGKREVMVEERITSLMGCSYSQFTPLDYPDDHESYLYDPAMTSLYVDDLIIAMERTGEILWEYINIRTRIVALESELKKSLLRINSLDQVVLPQLEEEESNINEVLGERSRQEQYAIKKIKKKNRQKKERKRESKLK